MIFGQLAFLAAALFTGAALYINAVEQPARLGLDDRALLTQWKPSYKRATVMQVPLVLASFAFGFGAWIRTDHPGWIVGALLMLANLPVTLRIILPVNRRLLATAPAEAGPESRALILRWGSLHAIRTGLGFFASFAYLTAIPT